MCRNQSEVTTILNNCDGDSDDVDAQTFEEGIPNLSRLRLAVNYNQKQVQAWTVILLSLSVWLVNKRVCNKPEGIAVIENDSKIKLAIII